MYELFQALLSFSGQQDDDQPAPTAPASAETSAAPDFDKCFEAVEHQLFEQP